ncbi:MAG: hypothetical protein ACKO7W_09360 [Elainella sp.]
MDLLSRLELTFKAAISEATADLIAADLRACWQSLEPLLQQLPEQDQLRLGGTAIAELAEVCQLRAERLLVQWEEQHNDTGPAMAEDLLAGLVQRTMYLDISDLVRQPAPRQRRTHRQSLVGVVEKAKLLAFVDQAQAEAEETAEAALAVAHEEDVSGWVATIAAWMQEQGGSSSPNAVPLLELQRSLQMPLIQVWLALLLGGYGLESRGGFYESEQIWVDLPR